MRSRARCAVGRREPRGLLRYTDDDWAAIERAAARERMRPGAWAQLAAHEAAVWQGDGVKCDRAAVDELVAELGRCRRVLTNIGGNLNQLARAANAGRTPNELAVLSVLRLVRRVVHGLDEVVGRVRGELLR